MRDIRYIFGLLLVLTVQTTVADAADYSPWTNNLGAVTWIGSGTFTTSNLQLFYPKDGTDGKTYSAGTATTELPGYEGTSVKPYLVFQSTGSGKYKDPGYAIRITAGSSYKQAIDYNQNNFHLGGLILEPGATGFSFTSASASRKTWLGDTRNDAGIDTWYRFGESFTFARGKKGATATSSTNNCAVLLYGKLHFDIAEGKTVDLNSSIDVSPFPLVWPEMMSGSRLRLHGLGTLKVLGLNAKAAAEIDFSDTGFENRSTPYIDGNLTLGDNTSVVIPSGVGEEEPYVLCTGTLVAPTGERMGPMDVAGEKKMVVFEFDPANRSVKWREGLCPEADVEIPEGYSITIPTSVNPDDPYVWSGKMTVNGTLNVSGYVNFDNTFTLNGNMVIDPTAFAESELEKFALVNVPSGTKLDPAKIQVTDTSKWEISISGNTIYLCRGGYAHWLKNPGMFNWMGTSLQFKTGKFQALDVSSMQTGKTYDGASSYVDVPGQVGKTVSPFWSIFSEGSSWVAPGYAIRFASGAGTLGAIDAQFENLILGGVIVEAGAAGASLASSSSTETRSTVLGDTTGKTETWFSTKEDFAIERGGKDGSTAKFAGKVVVNVADDKTLSYNVTTALPVELDPSAGTRLCFRGDGRFAVGTLVATNSVSLDFTEVSTSRSLAFINGALTVDDDTIFRLPADLPPNTEFKLCQDTLTILGENKERFFYLGDEVKFAKLEFQTGGHPNYVKYTGLGKVNTATVSNDVEWTKIVWNDGDDWKSGCPGLITLTGDAKIAFSNNWTMGSIDLVLAGNHLVTFVCQQSKPDFASVRCGEGARCNWLIPYGSKAFSTDAPLPIAAGEEWYVEGKQNEGAEKSPMEWNGAVTVSGTVWTVGHVAFGNEGNVVVKGGKVGAASGTLKLNGAKNKMSGTVEVANGAKLEFTRAADLLDLNENVTLNVRGELAINETRVELGAKTVVNLYGGGEISGDGDGNGALDFNKMPSLNVIAGDKVSSSTISAAIRYRNGVVFSVGEGATLNVASNAAIGYASYVVTASGAGTINLKQGALVPFSSSGFCDGGLIGSGTAFFRSLPADKAIANLTDPLLWDGKLAFSSVALTSFNPNRYGNAGSVISFEGCSGSFVAGETVITPDLEMATNAAGTASLKITGGSAGAKVEIASLSGNGKLQVTDTSTAGAYGLFLPNGGEIGPSIALEGTTCKAAVFAGSGIAEFAGELSAYAGSIQLLTGASARIGTDATWSAANGIQVEDVATLTVDGGSIGSKVSGRGTVRYTGDVGNAGIEEVAGFDDSATWSGTVKFEGAYFHSTSFEHIGNDNSTVKFSQTDMCSASAVVWPKELAVDADEGDVLFVFDSKPTPGFEDVVVKRAGETWKQFGLEYDSDIKGIYVIAKTIPPSFTVDGCRIEYGSDLAQATFVVKISDYVHGSNYDDVSAVLTVYDVYGAAIEQRGLFIDGDGEYAFDPVDLRSGRESGYSYSVSLTTKQGPGEIEEELAVCNMVDYAVRPNEKTDWVDEDSVSFAATDPKQKTGEWTGEGKVIEGKIQVGEDESIGLLKFDAYQKSSQSVAHMDLVYEIHEYGDVDTSEIPDDVQTMLTVMGDGYEGLCFAAWSAQDRKFVKLYGSGAKLRPEEGDTCLVRASFNYTKKVVSFQMDGSALTNASGCAFIPIRDTAGGALRGMRFRGTGTLTTLTGEQQNGDLAALVSGSVTNRYATVDDAIAASGGGSTKVTLLWDASWSPATNYLGKVISYDGGSEGYVLSVNASAEKELERQGYVVIRNPDGSYSVGVTTFSLLFNGNGGEGEMEAIPFTATNAVVKLTENLFTKAACDFAYWNAKQDGSGDTNYENCATIDLSPYGATNVTLFAQWKIASRRFTVATPDPRVYIEQVETNSAVHADVRYYRRDTPGEAVSAVFNVENGSRVVVRFSTNIETNLVPYTFLDYKSVESPTNIPYADLPKIPGTAGALAAANLTKVQQWAAVRGIPMSTLSSSPFASVSCELDTKELITQQSELEISDFKVEDGGCTFKVKIDDWTIAAQAIAKMVLVSDDIINWTPVPEKNISIDTTDGTVRVETDGVGKFIKIVIPRD